MNLTKLSLIPLQQASLCLDCETITAAHTHCFACGSAALLNLARTLNGGEYARPLPGTLTAAGISGRRDFEPLSVPGTMTRKLPRFHAESICCAEMSTP
jgi:hypothetical protein